MVTVLSSTRGTRLFIFVPPAAQAPPPPVRVDCGGHFADAHVLGTPPASLQLVEPELMTPVQAKPTLVLAQDGGAPAVELCVNTIAGDDDDKAAGVPTRLRLF